jgi:hypothetical protein
MPEPDVRIGNSGELTHAYQPLAVVRCRFPVTTDNE